MEATIKRLLKNSEQLESTFCELIDEGQIQKTLAVAIEQGTLTTSKASEKKRFDSIVKEFKEKGIKLETFLTKLLVLPAIEYFTPDDSDDSLEIVFKTEMVKKIRNYGLLLTHLRIAQKDGILTIPEKLIDECKTLIEQLNPPKKRKRIWGWDELPGKDPQKHTAWKKVIVSLLNHLEPFYPVQQDRLEISAYFLKVIYPHIWKEDIKTISERLRQKDYRVRNPIKTRNS